MNAKRDRSINSHSVTCNAASRLPPNRRQLEVSNFFHERGAIGVLEFAKWGHAKQFVKTQGPIWNTQRFLAFRLVCIDAEHCCPISQRGVVLAMDIQDN